MTELNKAVIGVIRVVMESESSREKSLTVSKVRYITSFESQN